MNKRKQGISQRKYAIHAGVGLSYIQKLLEQGKIPVLPDGSLDPEACDAARSRNTRVGLSQLRQGKVAEPAANRNTYLTCAACGDSYSLIDSRWYGTGDPLRFCTRECQADHERGLSRATIRRRIFKEANA